ncbi:hypothetical protein V1512DRAFT_254144 [Lipomyces arxii]|uniref:uncharacterized protein n=1 Tax=Lipomyces arxii TaxID=56418 RepID=UPI0034CF740D
MSGESSPNLLPPNFSKSKRIVLLCDGTWEDSIRQGYAIPSNISRLARAIKPITDSGKYQMTFYHYGLGTTGNWLDKISGGAVIDQIADVYASLAYNYIEGDEIFLFGFSRGSYMVRALCSFILDFGILTKTGMSEFASAYAAYRSGEFAVAQNKLKENGVLYTENLKVKVLGCFDTVGALGIPHTSSDHKKYEFMNLQLSAGVEHAFHALALEEAREPYIPTLWFFPKGSEFDKHPERYKQTWFTGVHINIGGGNMSKSIMGTDLLTHYLDDTATVSDKVRSETETANVLSDGTLIWMIAQCKDMLDFDIARLHEDILSAKSRYDGEILRHANRAKEESGDLEMAPWNMGPIGDNSKLYISLGRGTRNVGGYAPITKDQQSIETAQYTTHERVHQSVVVRHKRDRAVIKALRHVDVVTESDYNTPEIVIEGTSCERNLKPVEMEVYSDFELEFWDEELQDIQ